MPVGYLAHVVMTLIFIPVPLPFHGVHGHARGIQRENGVLFPLSLSMTCNLGRQPCLFDAENH